MELDELKMAWGQFNDKINGQELVGREQLKQMLAKKKMSNYSRLLWYERISLSFLFFVFLGLFACFLIVGPFYWMSVTTMLSIVVLVALGVNLFQYCKLKQAGCMKNDLEHQILYILQYKSSLYWGYISIYIAVIPGIVLFIIYAAVLWSCIIVGIVLLLTILDVFIFRHLFRKVGQLLEANQELKRMEAIIGNQ